MPGSVYVFNLFSEPISNLMVGGFPAGSISGYADGSSAPVYTPASLPVPRVKFPADSAAFALGDNSLVLPWDSFRGVTTVTIPSPSGGVSLDDSLILLLAVNSAMLLSARGYVLATFPVMLSAGLGLVVEPDPS
jgi:hypothetical protein